MCPIVAVWSSDNDVSHMTTSTKVNLLLSAKTENANTCTPYWRCFYNVFYTYDELYYEDFTSAT